MSGVGCPGSPEPVHGRQMVDSGSLGVFAPAWVVWAAAIVLGAAAPVSWWAAWRDRGVPMAISKPLPMIALGAAVLAGPWRGPVSVSVLVALGFGLVGDVALLVGPSERAPRPWALPVGLGAFLLGHLAYLAAIGFAGQAGPPFPWPAVLAAPVAGLVAWRWGRPVARASGRLSVAVATYQAVILALAIAAAARGPWPLLAGAVLFVASDLLLGRSLFLARRPWSAPLVMVTYHLAQVLLVAGLVVWAG